MNDVEWDIKVSMKLTVGYSNNWVEMVKSQQFGALPPVKHDVIINCEKMKKKCGFNKVDLS